LAVKIRLARAGAKKAPFYRVVAADSRSPRDGRLIEVLGRYNPRVEPSFVELDLAKVDAWIGKGATPTEAAAKLIAIARGEKKPLTAAPRPSKKAAAKAGAKAEAAAKPAEPVEEPAAAGAVETPVAAEPEPEVVAESTEIAVDEAEVPVEAVEAPETTDVPAEVPAAEDGE
jgi:small subunit ribosomal protein S16